MFGARPTFFVTRPNGTRTALVEVDQLPASIKIAGVPANLPAADTADMTCVGNRERAPLHYIIEIAAVSPSTSSSAGIESPLLSGNGEDREPQNGLGKKKAQDNEIYSGVEASIPSRALAPVPAPVVVPARVVVSAPVMAPAPVVVSAPVVAPAPVVVSAPVVAPAPIMVPTPTSAPAPASTPAPVASPALKNTRPRIVPGKKTFCTYWIRTGGCDFMQQGCIYKHVMPEEETLKDLGFPEGHPKWYRDSMRRGKSSSRLAAKKKGRINSSRAPEARALPQRPKSDSKPTASSRRIEDVPTVRLPTAETTSPSSSIPDHFAPLIPLSWRSNDIPALQPSNIAPNVSAFASGLSSTSRPYVDIKIPLPQHRYLFGDGAADKGKGKSE